MQDMDRELESMEGQEQTQEQQDRQQQLAEQQQQLLERMQQAQQAMEDGQEGEQGQQPGQQPGQQGQEGQEPGEAEQPGEAENQTDVARGGAESMREIKELWLGMLESTRTPWRRNSGPFPNYERAIRDLRKLETALEKRLNLLQEKKQLAQVAKEDVPPEYRKLVDNYYESLAK